MSTAPRPPAHPAPGAPPGAGPAPAWRAWVGWALLVLAFAAGVATDALSAGRHVNLLAVPMLGVLAWNLLVYLLLVLGWLAAAFGRRPRMPGPLQHAIASLARRLDRPAPGNPHPAGAAPPGTAPLGTAPLGSASPGTASPGTTPAGTVPSGVATPGAAQRRISAADAARAASLLHAAAAALAAGLIASLYLRGLAFEYLAGWESTFLGPEAVRRLIGLLLGPASALTGIGLPDAAHLAGLRFSAGPGENAAPWINLYAVTLALYVLLPRIVLAWSSARQARRLERRDALRGAPPGITSPARTAPADDDRPLARPPTAPDDGLQVLALPYSFQLPPGAARGLRALATAELGVEAELALLPSLSPEQAETPEGIAAVIAGHRPALALALFNLSATPEPQTHAAFVAALRRCLGAGTAVRALVDETAFRARFAGTPQRLDARRGAWRTVLAEVDAAPRFVSLGAPDPAPPAQAGAAGQPANGDLR